MTGVQTCALPISVRREKNFSASQLLTLSRSLVVNPTSCTSVTSKSRPDWIEVREDDPLANEKRAILAIWKGLGYSMSSLDTRVKRNFGVESFAWLHDTRSVCMLLSDLQRRERARKRKQDVNG